MRKSATSRASGARSAPLRLVDRMRRRLGGTQRNYNAVGSALLLAPTLALLLVVFVVPITKLLATSFGETHFTLSHYARLVEEPLYVSILLRTFRVASLVTLFTLALGYPVAYVISRLRGAKAALVMACVLMPLWTSVLVRSYAWTVLLQRNGLVNGWLKAVGLVDAPLNLLYSEGAVLLAMTHVLLPFMILPLYGALRGIPEDLVRAAQNLGAGPSAVFRRVLLPLSLQGVAAGAVIVLILSLGFFITPALVGGPRTLMIATLINQQVTLLLNWPFAGALAGVLLGVTLLLVLAFNRVLRLGAAVGYGA